LTESVKATIARFKPAYESWRVLALFWTFMSIAGIDLVKNSSIGIDTNF
jgi:hypothetical protein